jgi:hypothetical protein
MSRLVWRMRGYVLPRSLYGRTRNRDTLLAAMLPSKFAGGGIRSCSNAHQRDRLRLRHSLGWQWGYWNEEEMEPRRSLSLYVFLILLAVALVALRGLEFLGLGVGVGVALFAATLDLTYLFGRWRWRHHVRHVLWFRRRLDRTVRAQWLVLAVLASIESVVLHVVGLHPLDHAADWVRAVSIGALIATTTLYVSAAVDWYWILPKISGLTGVPPCTRTRGKAFHPVTKVWYFHRAAATLIFTFVLAGVPAYLAGTISHSGSERAALTLLGTALAIGFNAAVAGSTGAFRQFLSPKVVVGDLIRVRESAEDPVLKDAIVVDVSIQGLKYTILDDFEKESGNPEFSEGVLLPIDEVPRVPKSKRTEAPCPSLQQCRAVNWYCMRNQNANNDFDPTDFTPVALGTMSGSQSTH